MNPQLWTRRVLGVAVVVATAAGAILWGAALTAKCEGFGCLGVGVMLAMAVAIQAVAAGIGGVLIALLRRQRKVPAWLLLVELGNLVPVAWFGGRWLLG